MATGDGGNDFFGYMPDMGGSAPSMPSTLGGGDASQAAQPGADPYGRKNQWGLLGLYGDNGNLSTPSGIGYGGGGQSVNSNIDPYTGQPYGFAGVGNTGNLGVYQPRQHDWSPIGPGWDGNPDVSDSNQIGFSPDFLKQLGYNGPDPGAYRSGEGDNQSVGSDPAFFKYLQDNNFKLATNSVPGWNQLGAFDSKGNQKAFSQGADEPDDQFGLAMALAGGVAGAAVGGAAAGSAYGAAGGTSGATNAALAESAAGTAGYGASSASIPGWVTAAGSGAGGGFGSTMVRSGGDIGQSLKAGALGGVTAGVTQGLNPASYAGIDDPTYARGFNNAATAGGRAALTGGNIGSSVLGSLQTSALGAGLKTGASALGGSMGEEDVMQPTFGNYSTPLNQGGYFGGGQDMSNVSPAAQGPGAPYGGMPDAGQGTYSPQTGGGSNPVMDFAKNSIKSFTGPSATPGNFDNMAGNLMQLWQSRKNAGQYGQLANNLNSLYIPNSPYAQQLNQTLTRSDAAAGRRSQVGPRNVELQARLAQLNSQNAPELARLYASQQNNQGQQLQSLMRLGMNPMISGGVSDLWKQYMGTNQQPSFNATANQNPDWAPGD